ncbi:DNA repair protein RadC [Aliivibrio sp. S4TY2]|uniref:RadC family protein n=1 Tax=unclassified Aliivibrio TaxID=2645654 RepID=UPI0023789F3E|nr:MULTISPECIES: DNA repair protein RadC [unclassified Aliivibrio]MDD9156009.1 DNA repair protein RadC [Aliivibrio sp. S4TY2]MDD9159718.1 DNA repair protein RadC [Aliivibrio sp. S4TY1]MDD9163718.1 DNA repair protein RadC [Aliivibrio sp. S4MY2]MDD9167718.1 DNA repair protein RadC [Aliivibrio sp. S4MY4]MDD9185618.1 DNA repair protein RadC [Aliivibrio sp. S4MY3]
MSLMNLPEESRPREKLLALGPKSLTDAELLAIFLCTGIRGMNAIELADKLLKEFGSLRKLLSSNEGEFCSHKGLGTAKFAQLQAVVEMTERYLFETMEKEDALTSPEHTKRYLTKMLRDRHREAFYVLFLDNQHRVLKGEVLFEGTIDAAAVYPREVVKRSIDYNAAAIILAHNHPSGVAEPSQADRRITKRISDAVELVDIRVLDHFVIGDGEIVSFAERGWI